MTLPDWIIVDTVNSRLVGMAGVYPGVTKDAANAAAQAAIDAFGDAAIAGGNLTCGGCDNPDDFIWTITNYNFYGGSISSAGSGDGATFDMQNAAPGAFDTGAVISNLSFHVENSGASNCTYRVTVDYSATVIFGSNARIDIDTAVSPTLITTGGSGSVYKDIVVPGASSDDIYVQVYARGVTNVPASICHFTGSISVALL